VLGVDGMTLLNLGLEAEKGSLVPMPCQKKKTRLSASQGKSGDH